MKEQSLARILDLLDIDPTLSDSAKKYLGALFEVTTELKDQIDEVARLVVTRTTPRDGRDLTDLHRN
jgi:hypothetical protein